MQKISTEQIGEKIIILLQGDLDAADQRLNRLFVNPSPADQELGLWIDCSSLECIKTFGVCHFISQLLVLKSMGANIRLLRVGKQHNACCVCCRCIRFSP
ncbi:hypothetical protein ACFSC6_17095 [Rufibacter sediminis]|uniref:STAS domain-containing protein n=1 Tax=Rufibacter sediminis TaxID=2762756 RepID=A0ABR6VV52_9BACT|nr:hypothetical protein [Rufibacter sediminis]MBC3541033.1 hypothetical protein [Rufibacter sediminis]